MNDLRSLVVHAAGLLLLTPRCLSRYHAGNVTNSIMPNCLTGRWRHYAGIGMIRMNKREPKKHDRLGDIHDDVAELKQQVKQNTDFRVKWSTAVAVLLWILGTVLAVISVFK